MKSGPNKFGIAATGLMVMLCVAAPQANAAHATGSDTTVNTYQSTETVRLTVGHSMVLNTQVPLKRVYVGNPLVLLSYTAAPNQIVLTAKATGTSSLMVWDINGSSKLYTVEVDIDPTAVQDALKVEYPNEPIVATVTEDHVALSGNVSTKDVADGAQKLAEAYSKLVVSSLQITGHPREVRLKVRIAEVDRTKLVQFGVNLLSAGKQVATTSTTQFPNAAIAGIGGAGSTTLGSLTTSGLLNPLNFFYYNAEHGLGISIQDLAQQNVLQILAEPTLSAMSGQPASFLSGGEFPYPTIQASAGSTPVVTISFRPYGIKIDFTPTVAADGTIRLKVAPEVSSLDYANAVQISGYTIPALSTRRADTQVELKSGQTFMIGGLLDHQTSEQFARTPGIASIPILGELFKSKNNNHSVTELVVFVTPELVDEATPNPSDPKPSVPSLSQEDFDKQINKNKAANPNTNRDTGDLNQPWPRVPQQSAPVTATATPVATPSTPAPVVSTVTAPTPQPTPVATPVVSEATIAPAPTPVAVAAPVTVAAPVAPPVAAPVVAETPAAPAPAPVPTPAPEPVAASVVAETPAAPAAAPVATSAPEPVAAPVVAETPAAPAPAPVATSAPEPVAAPAVAETPATPVATPAAPVAEPVAATPAAAPAPSTDAATTQPAATAATEVPADATATSPEPAVPALLAAPDAPDAPDASSTSSTQGAPAAAPATQPTPTATPAPAAAPEPETKPDVAQVHFPQTLAAPAAAALQQPAATTAGPAAPQTVASAAAPKMRLRMKTATN